MKKLNVDSGNISSRQDIIHLKKQISKENNNKYLNFKK